MKIIVKICPEAPRFVNGIFIKCDNCTYVCVQSQMSTQTFKNLFITNFS